MIARLVEGIPSKGERARRIADTFHVETRHLLLEATRAKQHVVGRNAAIIEMQLAPFLAAEPASGSDMPRLITVRPAKRSARYLFFRAGEAYSANVRIGPKLPDCTTSALRGQTSATCSIAITASISEPPWPPSASASVMPIRPCWLMRCAASNGKRGLWARLSASASSSATANLRTASAHSFCSSVNSKFIERLFRLRAGGLDDLRPLGLFMVDVDGIFLRRARQRLGALDRQPITHLRGL